MNETLIQLRTMDHSYRIDRNPKKGLNLAIPHADWRPSARAHSGAKRAPVLDYRGAAGCGPFPRPPLMVGQSYGGLRLVKISARPIWVRIAAARTSRRGPASVTPMSWVNPRRSAPMSRCPVVFPLSRCDAGSSAFYKEKVRTSGHRRQISHLTRDTSVTCLGHGLDRP